MVDRILMTETRLTISKPGFDVNVATKRQLQFSTDWRNMEMLASGTIVFPTPLSTNGTYVVGVTNALGAGTQRSLPAWNIRVPFGDTYPAPPIIFCNSKRPSESVRGASALPNNIFQSHVWSESGQNFNSCIWIRNIDTSGFDIVAYGQTTGTISANQQWWAGISVGWTAWRMMG